VTVPKRLRQFVNFSLWYLFSPRRMLRGLRETSRRLFAYLLNMSARFHYPHQYRDLVALQARRTSDTLFIFGAGTSLYDVTASEWAHVAQHNTLGWNLFAQQTFVRGDFYIFRELHALRLKDRRAEMQKLVDSVGANPQFKNVLWLVQRGPMATNGNLLLGWRLLPPETPILRFKNAQRGEKALPGPSLDKITHGVGTLTDAVNLGYVGGWKRLVLIGVDLYDTRYFVRGPWEDDPAWTAQKPDASLPHPTARRGIVPQMAAWRGWLAERGVELMVYNPRSLLAQVLPIYPKEPNPPT